MGAAAAAEVDWAKTPSAVRHEIEAGQKIQSLIRQGEATLVTLYNQVSPQQNGSAGKSTEQVPASAADTDHDANPCIQAVSEFCTAAANGLQLLFAGALAPDANSLRLSAETQRDVLRLLDLLHIIDVLKPSLCKDAANPKPQRCTDSVAVSGMAEEKHQPASAEGASADGNSICEDAAVDSVNGDTASSTSEGVKPGESASTAPGSAAVGPGKGADYPLGSLEVWAARWGALRLVCRRVAAVPHHHHVSAGLALHAQQALSASDKLLLPEERLALLHALPAALFLVFSAETPEAQAMDAIGGPKTLMRCLKVLRARPVVAAFGERPMSLVALLQASPYLFNLGAELGKDWVLQAPQELQGKQLAAVQSSYSLAAAVTSVKASHRQLSSSITSLAIRVHALGARRLPLPLKVAAEAMTLTEAVLKSLSTWTGLLTDSHCWHTYQMSAGNASPEDNRAQQSSEELGAMLEIMNCLAGLAGQLLQEQEWLAPLLQQSVRRQAQRIAELLSAAIAKPSLPRRVLDAADAVRAAIISWSGAPLQEERQQPPPLAHRASRLRCLAASVMRASGQRPSSLKELAAGGSSGVQGPHGEGIVYGVEAVGPTELQRLTLICAVEALLKEGQPSGVTGLIKQGPLGDGLMKEFHAFHASLLCWPNLLDLPSSVQQASSLASLGLQECSSAPSATSAPLPLLLLRHALRGGCPPELCLLPLGLYTHALAFCKERLGCERMSQAAEAAAHAAFEELLALLADAVFQHAKQVAAASLREFDPGSGNAAAERLALDHFRALLRRPGVQLPGNAVSLRARLAPKVAQLFSVDTAEAVASLTGADCPCETLPELDQQIQVLERAHRHLTAILNLPPWTCIWAQSPAQQAPHPATITERATAAVLQLISSPSCTYCSEHRRFVAANAHTMDRKVQKESLPPQAASAGSTPRNRDLNGGRGSCGSGPGDADKAAGGDGAAGWSRVDSLGDAELAAFARLTGPGGVAHLSGALTEEACRCVTQCYAALSSAASAAGSSIHCSQPVTGPAELFGLLTPALAAVADCEESQRALRCLRCLRCLGGAQLVLLHLDAHLSTRGTAQFLAAAPLLGVAPNELGALEQPGAGEVTPIAGALFEACAEQRVAHASASSEASAALHTANSLLQQGEGACWEALEPPQLVPGFLADLRRELAPVLAHPPTPDSPSPVPPALSALLFALANPQLGICWEPEHPVPAVCPELPADVSALQNGAGTATCVNGHAVGSSAGPLSFSGDEGTQQEGEQVMPGAESPTRPQAAERMDDAIQQGLELWTPTRGEGASEWPEAPGSDQPDERHPNAAELAAIEPPQPASLPAGSPEGRQATGEEDAAASPVSECVAAMLKELPEHNSGQKLVTEDAPEHAPELLGAPGASEQHEVRADGSASQVDHAEHVKEVNGSANGLAAQGTTSTEAEQHRGRRKWKFKLPSRTASGAFFPEAASEAAGEAEPDTAGNHGNGVIPKKAGFLSKRLPKFGRSWNAASTIDEASAVPETAAAVAVVALQQHVSEQVDADPQGDVHSSGAAVIIAAQPEGPRESLSVRRSQSEAAGGNGRQKDKGSFLKKQLTRFGRARAASEGHSGVGGDSGASLGALKQPGRSRNAARLLGRGDLMGASTAKWPAEELSAATLETQEKDKRRWQWPGVGDAPLWGVVLLLELLQLQPEFQLQDSCRLLLLEADMSATSGGSVPAAVAQCIACLRGMQHIMEEALDSLSARGLD